MQISNCVPKHFKMRNAIYIRIIIPAIVLLSSCREKEIWVIPQSLPITEALFASGHIEPVQQVLLTSLNEGYLHQVFVKEADVVKKGEVLFALDNRSIDFEELAARKNLQIATKNASPQSPVLQKLKSDLVAAQQKRSVDSVQYNRLKDLYESRAVSQLELDNSRLQFDMDVSNIKSIQENIEATELSLQQSLIQAQSQYQTTAVGNQYYTLRSPDRSRVYRIFKKQGELVRKGEAVSLIGHPDSLIVMLLVDEAGISKVQAGQKVLIELNTAKGQTYEARVSRIYPYFDNETQAFRVEAVFDGRAIGLIAGTLLQANIIVAHKDKAMLIPRSCLTPDGKVVIKRKTNRELITPVTGIVSTEWVEVMSGIMPTDEVLQSF